MATIPEDIKDLEKTKLEEIKLRHEIINLRDENLSNLEIIMKKRIVPIFLPLLTLTATILFFWFNRSDNQDSKAFERYKNEVDIVKVVWNDINEENRPHSIKFKQAIEYLTKIDSANKNIYIQDSAKIGINVDKRPIALLTKLIPELDNKVNSQNPLLVNTSKKEKVNNTTEPVAKQKIETNTKIEELKTNSYTVYIQYSNSKNVDEVQNLANQLKFSYVVPGIDYVNLKFKNQIKYYQDIDRDEAELLKKQLEKLIPNSNFDVNKINYSGSATKIIELWYNNEPLKIKVDPIVNYDIIIKEERRTAINNMSVIIKDKVIVYMDNFNDNVASIRINKKAINIKLGETKTIDIDNEYRVTIVAKDYRKITFRDALVYDVMVEGKTNK